MSANQLSLKVGGYIHQIQAELSNEQTIAQYIIQIVILFFQLIDCDLFDKYPRQDCRINANCKTIIKTDTGTWSWWTGLAQTNPTKPGNHNWKLNIKHPINGIFEIGILNTNKLNERKYCDGEMFCLWCPRRGLIRDNITDPRSYHTIHLKDMDQLEICLDTTKGQLRFTYNSQKLLSAFDNIDVEEKWSLVIVLKEQGQEIEMEDYQFNSNTSYMIGFS
eukprot:459020_1